ncbi:acyl carrier protein [Streptomyces europaeiscabiei]|uniref:acyl carrier protein n=1 Tax=Streptomyces europaeiscabiei TaxID=146819 RepID=UPI0029AAFFF9|nr:acyl carrier protein [Streptomyces europaeiscabiei]MDX3581670.1 acyl carrier protein [Streptomyces europaeiscabiei]MDX3616423.1 acyl carrier protein [Streptomyces europaeiscabiei]MDX3633158.1 acyl carrier protein [Streptomyces europaeiscabiei]MDX3650333.1 acyl carrier protein [Streptomyces europaeiscabiei]
MSAEAPASPVTEASASSVAEASARSLTETSAPSLTETSAPSLTEASAPFAITTGTVRELLSDRKVFPGVPDDLGDDAELVLDSLGLVWLLHVVEERYGLVVEPGDEDIAGLTSLRRLTEFLNAAGAGAVEGGDRVDR